MFGRVFWKNGLTAALCLGMGLAASEGAAQDDARFDALLVEVDTGLANASEVERDARWSGAIGPSEAARRVAITLAEAGHFDHAARIAAAIEDPWDQARAVREVVLAHLAREDLDPATRLADVDEVIAEIAREPTAIVELVVEIAEVLATQGEKESATEFVSKAKQFGAYIADKRRKGQAFALIASTYARLGETDLAKALIDQIEDEFWRAAGHKIVAILLAEASDFAGSEQVAALIDDEKIDERDKAYGHLAESLVLAGQPTEARRVVGRITGPERQVAALAMVGGAFASLDESGARDIFAEAEALAAGLAEPKAKALAQTALAWGYARAGWVKEATAAADRLVKTDAGPSLISSGLEQVAVALWSKGETAAALDEIGAAERCAALIKDADDRSSRQLAIVRVLIQFGEYAEAERLAFDIDDPASRVFALQETAIAYAGVGQALGAVRLAGLISAVSGADDWQGQAAGDIAAALAAAGEVAAAEEMALGIAEPIRRDQALAGIAEALAAAGQLAEAERIARRVADAAWRAVALAAVVAGI